MRCPRCRTENPEAAERCTRCGAPLRLRPEPPAGPLDRPLPLDRRTAPTAPPRPAAPPAPTPAAPRPPPARPAGARPEPVPGRLPAPADSGWDLGRPQAPRPAAPALPRGAPGPAPGPARRPPRPSPELEPDVEVEPVEVHFRRARPWKRAAAWLADGLVLAVFGVALVWMVLAVGGPRSPVGGEGLEWVLDTVTAEARLLLSILAVLLVAAFVHATLGHGLMGATLGKRLLGLRVISRDGRPLTLSRSAVRAALAVLSFLLLGLGCLLALFTRSGRALHDFLAGTYVVEVP